MVGGGRSLSRAANAGAAFVVDVEVDSKTNGSLTKTAISSARPSASAATSPFASPLNSSTE